MAKFCGKCGAKLETENGLCPNCDLKKIPQIQQPEPPVAAPSQPVPEQPVIEKTETVPQTPPAQGKPVQKRQMKAPAEPVNKQSKSADQAKQEPSQKKKKRKILVPVIGLTICALLLIGITLCMLVYFEVVDIPVVEKFMNVVGLVSDEAEYVGQSSENCYTPNENNIIYEDESESYGYVNNMILVFFNTNATDRQISEVVNSVNGVVVGKMEGINQYQVQVEATSKDQLEAMCKDLLKFDMVKAAIVDVVVSTTTDETPNDPWKDTFQGFWGVDWDEENPSGTNWWFEATKIASAWDYSEYFTDINVGIVDGGYDTDHEDLEITVLNSDVNSRDNHGTHVAGVIGATVNNNKGISGILKDVSLYGVDCYATSKQKRKNVTVSSLMEGIELCIQNDCKVINMSSGLEFVDKVETKEASASSGRGAAIYLAYFLDSYGKDFLIVQSAGNGDDWSRGVNAKEYNGWFAAIDEQLVREVFATFESGGLKMEHDITVQDVMDSFMVVGAVDVAQKKGEYQLASFSNYGDTITVCAPGVDVFSTINSGGIDGSYGYKDGTSMAAPIVSGIASMVWSVDQEMTAGQVKKIIVDTAKEKVLSRRKEDKGTYFMVDAEAAVKKVVGQRNGPSQGEPVRTTSDERDIVLVLDVSGSMYGNPMNEMKKASSNFVSTILKEDASIGIVTYESSSYMEADFSMDESYLTDTLNGLGTGGGTNIEAGLQKAEQMLQNSSAKKKIIVLMSDGEPNDGKEGDSLIEYADSIKDQGVYIYTLGFFGDLGGSKYNAQSLMEGIASDGCHYEVEDADNLVFFFEDIADQINGQKYIYIRIACPVDVTVTYDGETLCSVEDELNTRTGFGSLTFEENETQGESSGDNRVKVLRLREGVDYDIQIEGNGRGRMNYTIGFMDENGQYSDLRQFRNIKITKKTVIDTVAGVSNSTVLNVDEDGDGKYDLKYKAKENGRGELVDNSYLIYIAVGVVALALAAVVAIRKKSKANKDKTV